MEKLPQQTPDLTQQNIDRIAELFPSAITETKDADGKIKKAINFTTLKQLLSDEVVDGDECYEFTWVGKKQSILEANKPIRKTLRPAKDESKNWDTTENLYIEGDNLEVLKLLQNSYLGCIKMMYFDPPYNTGNDFVYRDNFAVSKEDYQESAGVYDEDENRLFKNTETNGRYHSDWCSMMYPRLQLARNLLTEDGVIFISIDDNEADNLRKICDEVFGEGNFFAQVIVRNNSRGQTYKQISKTHEYILVYTKSSETELNELQKDADNSDLNLLDDISAFNIRELRNRNPKFGRHNRPFLFYPFFVNPKKIDQNGFCPVSLVQSTEYSVIVQPYNSEGKESCWRWGKERAKNNHNSNTSISNLVARMKSDGNYNIYEKYRKTTFKPKSIWDENTFLTEAGTVELKRLSFNNEFDFPKPVALVKQTIELGTNEDDIILDFFSGSATTAHAVMQLNAEDGGSRKFIMVQLPEKTDEKSEAYKTGYKNICEIGKERIRRAGKKIEEELKAKSNNLGMFENEEVKTIDTGFRVLKLDSTNMKDVYYSADEYNQQMLLDLESNIKEDRNDLDLLFGVMLDWGVPLSLPHITENIGGKQVHFVKNTDLVACFEENITENVVREIAKRKPLRVVFRDSSFGSSPEKINVSEIFKTLSGDTTIKVI